MFILLQWYPRDTLSASISSAIYSCGAIGIFDAGSLRLRCPIAPSAYMPSSIVSNSCAFPMVIAAHPSDPRANWYK
ncbi:unnamed protein product [Coffea canephora]|uniref:DH200=94 genomic scaffold, scaffold_616 n=1 Tax=Coffea canephora TaxID=49390 RepID=A0A068VFX9_COFCA|nr:unnamed protein product [Coffea canephora]